MAILRFSRTANCVSFGYLFGTVCHSILIAFGLVASVANADSIADATQPFTQQYLAAELTEGVPDEQARSSFNCTEPIYAVFESNELDRGKHQFKVLWIDPDGKERERVEYEFFARDQVRIWGWLKLHRGAGNTLLSVFDSAAGMEDMIGLWTAKFLLDDEPIAEQDFDVLC